MTIFRQIKNILLPEEQRKVVVLSGLLFFSMFLEMTSISLVVPVIGAMTQSNIAERFPLFRPMLELLGHPSQVQLIVMVMLTLVSLYMLKTLVLSVILWVQNKFIYGVQASLSFRLFCGYLRQPWTFHLQRNSSQLVLNITSEVNIFISQVLQPFIAVVTEGAVLLGVLCLLSIFEPLGTLVTVGIFGFGVFGFQWAVRGRVLTWGKLRQHHDKGRMQSLHQGLGAVKDIKLLGRESDFFKQYNMHNQNSAFISQKQKVITEMPRLWIEFFAVLALAAFVFIFLAQKKPIDAIVPTLSLFAVAAFRIMPSLTRIFSSGQYLRYGLPVLQTLPNELKLFEQGVLSSSSSKIMSFNDSLVIESVRYKYPGAVTVALDGITLRIRRGMSVGFVGASGAGKSSLIDIILGLLEPTEGQIKVDGVNIKNDLRGWQNQLGYVPQTIYLTDDTLRRNVAFGLSEEEIDDEAVQRAIQAAQLDVLIATLPEGIDTFVGERGVRLSGGQRQRIGIARALYYDPAVLVLDEATSALDTETEMAVMDAVNALHGEKTLLIVAHRLSTVANCDWIYRMEKGKIVDEGSFGEVVDTPVSVRSSQSAQLVDSATK